MSFLARGDVTLADPRVDSYILDPAGLDAEDIAAAARLVAQIVGPFSAVEALPDAAPLAKALEDYQVGHGPLLIVAGVCATPDAFEAQRGDRDPTQTVGVALFNRGVMPRWAQALFQVHSALRS